MIVYILIGMTVVMQSVLYALFLCNISSSKYNLPKTILIFLLLSLAQSMTYPIRDIIFVRVIINFILMVLTTTIVARGTIRKRISISLLYCATAICAEFSTYVLFSFIPGFIIPRSPFGADMHKYITGSVACLVYFSETMIISIFWKRIQGAVRYRLIILLTGIPAFEILFLLSLYRENAHDLQDGVLIYGIISLIVAISVNYVMFKTISDTARYVKNEHRLEYLEMQEKLQFDYYQLAMQNTERLSSIKHDLANHLQAAHSLYNGTSDEKTRSCQLIAEASKQLETIENIVYCDHPVVNAILASKTTYAKSQGISMDIQIKKIGEIGISDIHICSLLSNLFDNAIEGCLASNVTDKNITVKSGSRSGYLIIKCANTCPTNIKVPADESFSTSKQDKEAHGHGLRIIKEIVKKYSGELRISVKEGKFEIVVLLRNP